MIEGAREASRMRMTSKTSRSNTTQQSKRRTRRVSKKLKTDRIECEEDHNTQDSIPPRPPSSSDSSSSSSSDQVSNEIDEPNMLHPTTGLTDEPSTQSFSHRLKILNLHQSEPSNEPSASSDSDHHPRSNPEELEQVGLATKLLRPKPRKTFDHSLNGSSSIHPTTPTINPVGSLAQSLTQALKSNDTKLLESCFLQQFKNNKHLIAHTIERLPRTLLHNLIEQIVICLNRKRRGYGDGATVATVKRTKTLIEWVRQVLLIHMSYLLAVPTLANQLMTLHASLQKRLNLHNKLLSLNGRVRLILSQIEMNKDLKKSYPVPDSKSINGMSNSKRQAFKSTPIPKDDPFKYAEEESSSSDDQEQRRSKRGSQVENDDQGSESSDRSDSGREDEDEGSIEEVVLRSGSDGDGSDDSDGDDRSNAESDRNDDMMEDFVELEANESRGEMGTDDDEDEDGDEDEDDEDDDEDDEDEGVEDADDSMEAFIDDRPLPSTEEDSDSDDD